MAIEGAGKYELISLTRTTHYRQDGFYAHEAEVRKLDEKGEDAYFSGPADKPFEEVMIFSPSPTGGRSHYDITVADAESVDDKNRKEVLDAIDAGLSRAFFHLVKGVVSGDILFKIQEEDDKITCYHSRETEGYPRFFGSFCSNAEDDIQVMSLSDLKCNGDEGTRCEISARLWQGYGGGLSPSQRTILSAFALLPTVLDILGYVKPSEEVPE